MPRVLTISQQIAGQVRVLEVQLCEANRKAAAKHAAGGVLLEYLKILGDGKSPNTAMMRKIRGAAAEFI